MLPNGQECPIYPTGKSADVTQRARVPILPNGQECARYVMRRGIPILVLPMMDRSIGTIVTWASPLSLDCFQRTV